MDHIATCGVRVRAARDLPEAYYYLVVARCDRDDFPVRLTPDRDEAFEVAERTVADPEAMMRPGRDVMAVLDVETDPLCVGVILFDADGKPVDYRQVGPFREDD